MTATYLRKGQGKSDNAYYAQSLGRWPLTKAVKVISSAIRGYYKVTQKQIRRWLEEIGPVEWHHVGKYATECNYYDTEEVVDAMLGDLDDSAFYDFCEDEAAIKFVQQQNREAL